MVMGSLGEICPYVVCLRLVCNTIVENVVEGRVVAGERFRPLALSRLPNRLEPTSGPLRPRLSWPLIPGLQQVRHALGKPSATRSRIHASLGQFMPNLP